ncbi:hypothetical protein B0H10DRAFT_2076003 [Mycena sp. CBHHK59/15]|nr:hypothetical protein B0H10DRAFT_2076003 [Mycena sp. CBHHK59/15]
MDFPLSYVVPALESIRSTRGGLIAVYCVSVYEWLETFTTEIKLIHTSRWNSIKVAYLLCRYYALFSWPFVLYAYVGNHTAQTCAELTRPVNYVLLPMQLFAQGVMLMRAYAFAGRDIRALVVLCVCYVALAATDVWLFCIEVAQVPDEAYDLLGGTGCFPDYAAGRGGVRLVIAMSASVVMDLVSLSVIVFYCLRKRSMRGSLGRTFIRQGLLAFGIVLVVHSVSMGVYFDPRSFHNGVGFPYILIISNVMACRVILDLRRKAAPTESEILRQHSLLVENAFANDDLWAIDDDLSPL